MLHIGHLFVSYLNYSHTDSLVIGLHAVLASSLSKLDYNININEDYVKHGLYWPSILPNLGLLREDYAPS